MKSIIFPFEENEQIKMCKCKKSFKHNQLFHLCLNENIFLTKAKLNSLTSPCSRSIMSEVKDK